MTTQASPAGNNAKVRVGDQYGNNPERPCQPLEAGPNIRVADTVHYSLNER
jgi:hypothetical protein